MAALLVVGFIDLLVLHGPDGQVYRLNPATISSIREPLGADRLHFAPNTHCVLVMSNGKFVAVRETCDAVAALAGR